MLWEVALGRDNSLSFLWYVNFLHYWVNIELIVVAGANLLNGTFSFFLYHLAFPLALLEAQRFRDSIFVGVAEVFDGSFWSLDPLSYLHVQLISGHLPVATREKHVLVFLVVDWLALAGFLFGVLSLSVWASFAGLNRNGSVDLVAMVIVVEWTFAGVSGHLSNRVVFVRVVWLLVLFLR